MKFLACLLGFLVFLGCEKRHSHKKENPENIINIAITAEYPPYIYSKDGKLAGFEIELINAVAGHLGKTIHFHDIDFHGIVKTVAKKQVDGAIASIAITPERQKEVDFSIPYHRSISVIVVPFGSDVRQIEDLSGKIVGVEAGTIYEKDLEKKGIKNVQLLVKNKFPEMFEALNQKRCQAIVTGYSEAHELQDANPHLVIIPIEGTTVTYSIIVPKNSSLLEPINKKLNEMIANGEISQLESKFFKKFISE